MTLEQRVAELEKEVEVIKMQLRDTKLALSCMDSSTAKDVASLSQSILKNQ